jgi:predicted PurR-regulated permease PerM
MTNPQDESQTSIDGRHRRRHRRPDGWGNSEILRTTALVIGMYLLVRLFWTANPLFFTAFLGLLFGLAVSSGVDRLTRFRIPRGLGAALIVIAFFAILFGFGAWMAPTIRSQATELRQRLPDALGRIEAWSREHQNGMVGMVVNGVFNGDSAQAPAHATPPAASPQTPRQTTPQTAPQSTTPAATETAAKNDSATIASTLRDRLGSRVGGAKKFLFPFITSTMEAVGGLLIIVFLSIYIAADPELYHRGIMTLFPRKKRRRAGEVLSAIADVLRRWLLTQLIAMAVIGSVTTIALLLLRVKAAFALGLLAGLLEFIPTFGPIISAVPGVAMGFIDSPEKALIVGGAYVLIQFMENHLLIPLLMKGGVDVPPALTILSQALMALIFGFIGLMVAVPLLAATMVAVKMLYVEDVIGERALGADENPRRGIE